MIYGHYFIAVYGEDDYILFIAETWQELADILGKKKESVTSTFVHYFNENWNCIRLWGQRCKAYLIDLNDDEEDEKKDYGENTT